MKKIGSILTMRGQVTEAENQIQLTLFDGRFDTGYRVVDFKIGPHATYDSAAIGTSARLETEPTGEANSLWNWGDNRQIAWAEYVHMWNVSGDYTAGLTSIIDPDNMIIEDLYLVVNAQDEGNVNYMIQLQKYDISEWQGALSMVRNRSQA